MTFDFRYPNITGATEREQLQQMKTYVHQLVDELKWALNAVDSSQGNYVVIQQPNTGNVNNGIATMSLDELDIVGGRTISDTGWISLGLSSEVAESALNTGRSGKGCYYRVINGNHVYVAFNCSFQYENAAITIGASKIPAPYKPARNMYAFNPTNGRGIARVFVNSTGDVRIDYVQNMASAETTSSVKVNWIDGYIDYWI